MSAKNTKTGVKLSASHLPAKWWVHAPKTYYPKKSMKRLTPEQLHARLIVFIGCTLALVFAFSVIGMLYALIFVTQPIGNQAPNSNFLARAIAFSWLIATSKCISSLRPR